MSILVTELLSSGIVFGADKNLTRYDLNGTPSQPAQTTKVLRWPNKDTLFGFVGVAELNGKLLPEWLEFIQDETDPDWELCETAEFIQRKVQEDWVNADPPEGLIIHLAGFTESRGLTLPEVWHIANVSGLGLYGYTEFSNEFYCEEAFMQEMPQIHPSEIRKRLRVLEKQLQPFWFHQGFDYPAFNAMKEGLKASFRFLCFNHPDFEIPVSLADWEKHVKLQVLLYCSYFDAFHPTGHRFVGGGADILSIPWPSTM